MPVQHQRVCAYIKKQFMPRFETMLVTNAIIHLQSKEILQNILKEFMIKLRMNCVKIVAMHSPIRVTSTDILSLFTQKQKNKSGEINKKILITNHPTFYNSSFVLYLQSKTSSMVSLISVSRMLVMCRSCPVRRSTPETLEIPALASSQTSRVKYCLFVCNRLLLASLSKTHKLSCESTELVPTTTVESNGKCMEQESKRD